MGLWQKGHKGNGREKRRDSRLWGSPLAQRLGGAETAVPASAPASAIDFGASRALSFAAVGRGKPVTARVADIYRYPVKGLNAERLESVALEAGRGLPHDRRFAIAHGSTQFDPKAPKFLPKTHFLMLMRDEKLAQLHAGFEAENGTLTIERDGKQVVRAKVTEPMGRTLVGQFFAGFLADAVRGTPKLLEAEDHVFSDNGARSVSIINLASVRDLERVVRAPVAPLRFRGNLYLEDLPAWREFDWIGREIELGGVRLKVDAPIERCAATNVDPETAARDLNIPLALQRGFGHVTMGIYATVTADGVVAKGDSVVLPEDR